MPPAQAGFALVEVMVSALILLITSVGVVGLVRTTTHFSGEQRHSSEAYAIAQEDQARLRSMRLETLNHLSQVREIPLNGTVFKVESSGLFVFDKTSMVSCAEGTTSDYAYVTSKVTWPGMSNSEAARIESIVSPTNRSLDGGHGTINVTVANEKGDPMPGVVLSGLGPASATTDASGCATFPDLATVNYTLESSGAVAGLVTKDANSTDKTLVGAETGKPKKVALLYDRPGTVPVLFKYRVGSTAVFEPASADSVVASNTGMTTAKVFGVPGSARLAEVKAGPLFPFTSPDTVYAGSCASNNPNPSGASNPPGAAALASALVPAGGMATPVTIQLPALELLVKKSGVALSGATVAITDKVCKEAKGNFVRRTYTTDANGKPGATASGPPEPGLPWGTYEVCAWANISGSPRYKRETSVTVQSLTSATARTLDLGSGTSGGECP
jgi:Tfp pilus assembly protein PilV